MKEHKFDLDMSLRQRLENLEIDSSLKFSITQSCNLRCGHCGYDCSPDRPRSFIPKEDIIFYLNQTRRNRHFRENIGYLISGGEPTLVYDHDENYLRDIYKAGIDLNMWMSLKTNAYPVKTKHYDRFIEDLSIFENQHSACSVSLSGDGFHNNFDENLIIIAELYTNPRLQTFASRIVTHKKWLQANKHRFMDCGIPLFFNHYGAARIGNTWFDQWDNINMSGRGAKIGDTLITWEFEFIRMYIGSSTTVNYNFMDNGKCALEAGFDISIAVDYRDKNGNPKPIGQLRRELFDRAVEKLGKKYLSTMEGIRMQQQYNAQLKKIRGSAS